MLLQDLRFAVRTLRNSPGYALVAMASLALGIGANSTIFSLADGLLLRPLPVSDPGEIVTIRGATPSEPSASVSWPDYRDIRENVKSFDGVAAYRHLTFGYAESADALPQVKSGFAVSADFFPTLGVRPVLGRVFRPEEDQVPGRDKVAVLSYDLWQKGFASDPAVLGRTIRLNGIEFAIVGIAPESFTGMDQFMRPALFVPAHMAPALLNSKDGLTNRGNRNFAVKGRLRDGVGVKQAEAELAALASSLQANYPVTNRKYSLVARTELQERIEQSPPDAMLVAIMLAMVGLVLLIACANVANLMLSRARARSREMAVRLALGASRTQLIRQLMTESLLIAAGGAGFGLLLALYGVQMLGKIEIPTDLPIVLSIKLDQRVLWFTLLVSIASALLSGMAPAVQTSKADLTTALKAGDQGVSERKRFLGRNALVVMQVAFSMVLLICAAMMVHALGIWLKSDVGFRRDHILSMTFDPSLLRYTQPQANEYYKRLVEVTKQVPGVRSAALASSIPMANNVDSMDVVPEGHTFAQGQETAQVFGARVDENYFSTFAVTLVKGRAFLPADRENSPRVAIVNEEFARRYWQGHEPIGKRVRVNGREWAEVVGVTKTSPVIWIAEAPTAFVYVPFSQHPRHRMKLLVHTSADSASIAAPLRAAIRTIDPNQPVWDIRTIESFYQLRVVATTSTITQTFAAAGGMGLVLSLVGLYSLVSYSVSRRTREIGIRIAIGAGRPEVLRMVMRQGLLLSLIGIVLGFGGGLGAGKVLQAAFQMPLDPWLFASVPAGLLTVTLLATLVPALRATKVEPVTALRWE